MIGHFEYDGIRYMERNGVYPVESDSLLLIRSIEGWIEKGTRLMDMGTGTGLLTLVGCRDGAQTISVDREPKALQLLRDNLELNGSTSILFLSDLFDGIPRSYLGWADLITFNPPYLKRSENEVDRRYDLPLTGGKHGWEVARDFLDNGWKFLRKDGSIIMLRYVDWNLDILDPQGRYSGDFEVIDTVDMNGEILEAIRFAK